MNDLLNNNTKTQNIEELYYQILKVVEILYDNNIPNNIKNRKNKNKAKMKDAEIISIQLLIESLGNTQVMSTVQQRNILWNESPCNYRFIWKSNRLFINKG